MGPDAAGQTYLTGCRLMHGCDAPTSSPAGAFDLLSYPLAGLLDLPAGLPPAARASPSTD